MTLFLLPEEPLFPPVDQAEPDGLIAIGGDLSAERLLQAYAHGIFPWFSEYDDVFWYSPDPRMILFPQQFKISDSLKRIIRSSRFIVRFDTVFDQVIRGCAAVPRPGQDGTWISEDFVEAYIALFSMGFAHSVEVFYHEVLVGGLYGVSLGAAFFGESMFYTMSNASKVAFFSLVEHAKQHEVSFIDCQVETSHLRRLGASIVERNVYLSLLNESLKKETMKGPWVKKNLTPDPLLFRKEGNTY